MRADVARDWNWSDGYLPEVRRILVINALHFVDLSLASYQQDMKEATDMLVTVHGQRAIAVRLRRPKYHYRDLTIRAFRSNGVMTEFEKIKSGSGDFYLYGWTEELRITEWMVVNLHHLRESGLLQRQWRIIPNTEKTTGFIAIPYTVLLQVGCLVDYFISKGATS